MNVGSFETSNAQLLGLMRARWKPALAGGIVVAILAVAVSFLVPKRYTARAAFAVASDGGLQGMNRLAGFAAQLGIAGSLSSPESPDYFAQIAGMREVKLEILADTACVPDSPCGPLGEQLFGETADSSDPRALEKQLKHLSKRMDVAVDPQTGIIRVAATAQSPELAEAVLKSQLAALSRFVLERRESQARNERIFAEQRLVELEQKRKDVVAKMTKFYETNRSFSLSPALRFRERELQEELSLWQELIQSVARQGETARLNEARDIPAITVLEHPYASRKKTSPRRSLWAALGLVLGVLIGIRPDRILRGDQMTDAGFETPPARETIGARS